MKRPGDSLPTAITALAFVRSVCGLRRFIFAHFPFHDFGVLLFQHLIVQMNDGLLGQSICEVCDSFVVVIESQKLLNISGTDRNAISRTAEKARRRVDAGVLVERELAFAPI